jgi:RNA polymerase sigma-70 factor (ECF subfamily)
MKLVDSLPSGYRTVFKLYAIEGFSHQEIAKELAISENTSKSQLSRARSHLQRMIPPQTYRKDKALIHD